MARNPLINDAVDMMQSINALRLKRHELYATSEGIEVHQPGKPVLLLTYQAAKDFNHQAEEVRHG